MQKNLSRFVAALLAASTTFINAAPAMADKPEDAGPKPQFSIDMQGLKLLGSYQNIGGQPTAPATFDSGNVGAYPEGSCVPALIRVTNEKASPNVDFEIVYDYHKNGNVTDAIGVEDLRPIELTTGVIGDPDASVDNLNDIVFPGWAFNTVLGFDSSGGGVSATIAGPYGNDVGTTAVADNDIFRHYNVSLTGIHENATAYVLVCAKTGPDASEFPGSSMSVKVGSGMGVTCPSRAASCCSCPL